MNYDREIKKCIDDSDFYKGKRISKYDITEDKKVFKGNETLFKVWILRRRVKSRWLSGGPLWIIYPCVYLFFTEG